jgi:HlyD family secretion protein
MRTSVRSTNDKKVKGKGRLLMAALVACGLGSTWYMHRAAVTRGDWLRAWVDDPSKTASLPPIGHTRIVAEGRLAARPGAEVVVGAETGGLITDVRVSEKAKVRRGDVLVVLDSNEQRAAVAEAEARILEIDADIRYFEPKLARAKGMSAGTVSMVEMEQWQRDLEAARARRVAAVATLEKLKFLLSKTQIHAPIDGTVIARHCEPGQMIEPAGRLLTIADLSQCRLEAEVSEFDADGLVVGAPATVTAEGYPGQRWRAKVEEIPDVVAARKLRPQDPGRPSDTGVLLVKLVFVDPVPFKLGQRVDATIEVPKKAEVATVR